MRKRSRLGRHTEVYLLVPVVLVIEVVEWVLYTASRLARAVLQLIGLRKLEAWLKRRSMWFGLVFVLMIAVLKGLQYGSLYLGYYTAFAVLEALTKVVDPALVNYAAHIYAERLLAKKWIRTSYETYMALRVWVFKVTGITAARELVKQFRVWFRTTRPYRFVQRVRSRFGKGRLLRLTRRFVLQKIT